jgi:peptidylprolyl isomerase
VIPADGTEILSAGRVAYVSRSSRLSSKHLVDPALCVHAHRATPGAGSATEGGRDMKIIEDQDVVKVHYTGTLANGEVFDSSEGREPLEVTMGEGQLIIGFENALMGMAVKEKKTFTLAPDDAYGQRDTNAVHRFPRSQIPPDMEIEVGQVLALSSPQGQQVPAKVVELTDDQVILDLNHPLAGESLTFAIEVVGINA